MQEDKHSQARINREHWLREEEHLAQRMQQAVNPAETTQKEEAKGSKSSGEGAEGAIEDIGKSIKKLFGN